MNSNNKFIPADFLELAMTEAIPTSIATEVFLAKKAKKAVLPIAERLARQDPANDVPAAKKKLDRVWSNWNATQRNASIVLPDGTRGELVTPNNNLVQTLEPKSFIDQAYSALEKLIGTTNNLPVLEKKRTIPGRIAIGGDLHGIYADLEAVTKFCQDPAEEAWIMGDILDMYSASRYTSSIDHITMKAELAQGRVLMEMISASFKTVKIIIGNHDNRPLRRVQEWFPQLLPLIISPAELICKGLPNVEFLNYTVENTNPSGAFGTDHTLDYMGVQGDCVIGHFENFYGKEAARQCEKWISEWKHILKLPTDPKVIAQAHVHRLGMEITPQGRILISTGCLCRPMEYQMINHGKYQPPTVGYVAIYQDENGVTDLQNIQLIPL